MKIWLSGLQRSSNEKDHLLCLTFSHLLRLLLSMSFLHHVCIAECPGVCDCKWVNGKDSVMCIDKNLTAIPIRLDPGVLVFNFVGNSLLTLGNDVFELAGLMNLQKLHLVKCNIKYIERYAFRTLKNLVDLDLSYNVLTVVPSQAFAPIPDLRELKLNGNPILKIGSYAFTHVHQLIRLEISECRIGYIDPKAFNGLENTITWLKLSKNRIENLAPESFTSLQSLHGLDLSENPLNCSCVISPLKEWIASLSLSVDKVPSCRYPIHNSNKSWDRMQTDDFACVPLAQVTASTVIAYEGENVTLSCKVGGVPPPNVNWMLRNGVLINSTFESPLANKKYYVIHSLSNSHSNLSILSLETQDAGKYVCMAENKAGKVISDMTLIIEKPAIGTILSEKAVLIGILLTAVSIIFLCSIVVFIRVMCCKHDMQADIDSKRHILSEKIEMKRNSAIIKRSSSILPFSKAENDQTLNLDDATLFDQNLDCPLNSISEEDVSNKLARPKYLRELKQKDDTAEKSPSPSSSIFESHIGEIALQHHVLHKKQLPSGKLYTTAMAFMTDDMMTPYTNEISNTTQGAVKNTHYNTMPRNHASTIRSRKITSNYPRVSESQSPLLKNKYCDSSSESLNSNGERRRMNRYDLYPSYQKSHLTPIPARKLEEGEAYPSLDFSPDKEKYWTHLKGTSSTRETPLLNNIYDKKPKNNKVNYCTYNSSNSSNSVNYDYHAVQLERFLDEYRKLHSELTRMKETCEKFAKGGDINIDYLSSRGSLSRHHSQRDKLSLANRIGYDSNRYSSRGLLHRTLSSKSRSPFERSLQSKSCPVERSVSFVPALKDICVKPSTSDDVIVPKSILKKKNEASYYRNYKSKNFALKADGGRYYSNTLPSRRTRLRRYSDSSTDGFFID